MHRLITAVFLLAASIGASADSFWLLGSYPDRATALAEAERLSAETGIEVLLHGGGKRHRLMTEVMSGESDRQNMREQLTRAGVKSISVLNYGDNTPELESVFIEMAPLDEAEMAELEALSDDMGDDLDEAELAEIDAMLDDYDDDDLMADDLMVEDLDGPSVNYVVAASFTSRERAEAQSVQIDAGEHEVHVRGTDVGGTRYYRVLVGPVSESNEISVMRRLAEQGHDGIWMLRGVSEQRSSQNLDIGTPPRGFKVPVRQQRPASLEPKSYPGEDSDFNLAKLRKADP